jgi:hypothetical protein
MKSANAVFRPQHRLTATALGATIGGGMAKFTWHNSVQIQGGAPADLRPGSPASIVGVVEKGERQGSYFDCFPEGVICTVEFEDGSSVEVHEDHLIPLA